MSVGREYRWAWGSPWGVCFQVGLQTGSESFNSKKYKASHPLLDLQTRRGEWVVYRVVYRVRQQPGLCSLAGGSQMGMACPHMSCCANRHPWKWRTRWGILPASSQDRSWSCSEDRVVLAQANRSLAKDREPRTLQAYLAGTATQWKEWYYSVNLLIYWQLVIIMEKNTVTFPASYGLKF